MTWSSTSRFPSGIGRTEAVTLASTYWQYVTGMFSLTAGYPGNRHLRLTWMKPLHASWTRCASWWSADYQRDFDGGVNHGREGATPIRTAVGAGVGRRPHGRAVVGVVQVTDATQPHVS